MNLSDWWHNRSGMAKTVAALACALCLGIGLCGLDYLLAAHGIGKSNQEFGVGPLDGVSLLVMFLSAAGLGITLIVWLVTAIVRAFTSGPGDS
ncbi:MAG TPA: hypothetical protein VHX60_05110 [Acidobacteriaceae bacterium]|jgi:hypothetical protein|nr:hypothetical protein [Acidobacteriaceae bacterium]